MELRDRPPRAILVCPDKFRGSLSARAAAAAIARGLAAAFPRADVCQLPLADGGEGTLDAIAPTVGGRRHRLRVAGPLRRPVWAEYLLADRTAWIESAQAAGLHLVPPRRRDPGLTTTIGVGQLIEDALVRGAHYVNLFLGGTATNDGGAGMAGALGFRFFGDRPGDFIPTGNSLRWVRRIDDTQVPESVRRAHYRVLCDVDNPLTGPNGATHVFATQKGATASDLSDLEGNMRRFAERLDTYGHRRVRDLSGGGAAGGMAAGAVALLRAELSSGSGAVLDALDFDRRLRAVDLVVTGEGHLDAQTARGKLIAAVAERARAADVPTVALCGRVSLTVTQRRAVGLSAAYALRDMPGVDEATSMLHADRLLEQLAADLAR